jgi:hypothetical protein
MGVIGQFRAIESLLKRGEYDKARQSIANVPLYSISPELQKEWVDISTALIGDIDKQAAEAREQLRVKVDQLVKDIRQTCLAAKSSADLDPLLMRCAAMQMQRPPAQDIVARRIHEKLTGATTALQPFHIESEW